MLLWRSWRHIAGVAQHRCHIAGQWPAQIERGQVWIGVHQNTVVVVFDHLACTGGFRGFRGRRKDVPHRGQNQCTLRQCVCRLQECFKLRRQATTSKRKELGDHHIGCHVFHSLHHHRLTFCEISRIRLDPQVGQQLGEIHTIRGQRRQLHQCNPVFVQMRYRHASGEHHSLMPFPCEGAGKCEGTGQVPGAQKMGDSDQDFHALRLSNRTISGSATLTVSPSISTTNSRLRFTANGAGPSKPQP
mmetsp:Transcript_3060/g.5386  ORF Transcript_3060/g.5386 Transcript_3060/m.5386 type:complete len:245 (-) Transcript_3060:466-1200(-)